MHWSPLESRPAQKGESNGQDHLDDSRLLLLLRLLLVAAMKTFEDGRQTSAVMARKWAVGMVLTASAVLLYLGAACDWLIPRQILG
jgi:hypothetical protein